MNLSTATIHLPCVYKSCRSCKNSLVSVASDGTQGNNGSDYHTISANGRYVAFQSWATNLVSGDTNDKTGVFVHDLQTGEITRVLVASYGSQANGGVWQPSISANGHYVAFHSKASNLVSNGTNGEWDIFITWCRYPKFWEATSQSGLYMHLGL